MIDQEVVEKYNQILTKSMQNWTNKNISGNTHYSWIKAAKNDFHSFSHFMRIIALRHYETYALLERTPNNQYYFNVPMIELLFEERDQNKYDQYKEYLMIEERRDTIKIFTLLLLAQKFGDIDCPLTKLPVEIIYMIIDYINVPNSYYTGGIQNYSLEWERHPLSHFGDHITGIVNWVYGIFHNKPLHDMIESNLNK